MKYKVCFIIEVEHDKADFTESIKQIILGLDGNRITCTEGTSILNIDPDSLAVEVIEDANGN